MATRNTAIGEGIEHRDLAFWMERVLKELQKVQAAPETDAVHDLRVAIRRCRSVAAVMQEADPDPSWPEMKKLPRKLFRELGALRDAQVLEEWTRQLSSDGEPIRTRLLLHFAKKKNQLSDAALRAAGKFDQKAWKRSERVLRRRSRLVKQDGLAAECLALERLERAKELHGKAFRTTKPAAWHELRIGVKRFRYTVESLLPARYADWGSDLKRVQDLLGQVHDLDMLGATIREVATTPLPESQAKWAERIAVERNQRLEGYREVTLGKTNLWQAWRRGLPDGARLEAAGLARLRVTSRSLDKNLRRSGLVSALAMKLFSGMARVHAAPIFADANSLRLLRAAARVHGIGSGLASKLPQKAARAFLLAMSCPAAWTAEEWQLIAMIVRYHRGNQPQQKHKGFAKLSEEERAKVCAAAGVLRLARVLRKCGAKSAAGLRVEKSVDALIVLVPGLVDTEETAAGIAAGKYLLETCVGRPLLLKAVAPKDNLVELPRPLAHAAVASN